jgi:hypothetical protein
MPILSTGVRDKAAVSSPDLAPHLAMTNSALDPLEAALRPEEVVVHAPLILDLITASGSTLARATIATIPMLIAMLDSPISNLSVETLVPSASLVPSTARALALKPLSASSMIVAEAVAVLSSLLTLVASLLSAPRRVMSVSAVTVVLFTALIQLNTAALSVRRSALVVAWEEEPVITVSANAERDTRVKIALSMPN